MLLLLDTPAAEPRTSIAPAGTWQFQSRAFASLADEPRPETERNGPAAEQASFQNLLSQAKVPSWRVREPWRNARSWSANSREIVCSGQWRPSHCFSTRTRAWLDRANFGVPPILVAERFQGGS